MADPSLDDKITQSKDRLVELEREHTEAGFRLRTLKHAADAERELLYRLIDRKAGRPIPTLPGFDDALATANGTHDEHQRGPTSFPDMQEREAAANGTPTQARRKKKAGQGDASIAP